MSLGGEEMAAIDRGALYGESYEQDRDAALMALVKRAGGRQSQGQLAMVLAFDVSTMLADLDLPEMVKAILHERISRRLFADTVIAVIVGEVLAEWYAEEYAEDKAPTWPEILPDVVEAARQPPLSTGG